MYTLTTIAVLALAAFTSAAPTAEVAKALEARSIITAIFNDIGAQSSINSPYNWLQYSSAFKVISDSTTTVTARSPPLMAATTGNLGAINAKYPGSPYSSIDLLSFYFACNVACSLQVTGRKNSNQVGTASFSYIPVGGTSQMSLASLDSTFTNVDYVEFRSSSAGVTSIYLDDIKYNTRK
jgi:hypothetical protein